MAFPARQSETPSSRRAEQVEALLRERKLDRTLTTTLPVRTGADHVAGFGLPTLDAQLAGVPRGHVSELVGSASSGRTSLAWTWLGAATARGESVALIDTFDRFDPVSGAACGIDVSRLLWVRGQAITKTAPAVDPTWLPGARAVGGPGTLLERTIDRSLKALNLVLQSGVCTAVVLDFVDVPLAGIRQVPQTTWLRLQRIVEGTDVACLLLGPVPLARSAGGVTITTGGTGVPGVPGVPGAGPAGAAGAGAGGATGAAGAKWTGEHDRSRRLAGLHVSMRLSSPRRTVQGSVVLDTVTRQDAWAIE
ncbi:MAG TPA: hypothetical protein VMO26_25145 [Vicinamibacterales bacterium]|nr:hypothetical protein [Vicinamibacterales bacterium]